MVSCIFALALGAQVLLEGTHIHFVILHFGSTYRKERQIKAAGKIINERNVTAPKFN